MRFSTLQFATKPTSVGSTLSSTTLDQSYKMQECLKSIIPVEQWTSERVAVAGSCALYWFLLASEKTATRNCINWAPSGVNIFVAGRVGANSSYFRDFVDMCCDNLPINDYTIRSKTWNFVNYMEYGEVNKIWTCDVALQEIDMFHLSFVQSRKRDTVNDVVDGFDINIVKVMYNAFTNKIKIEESIVPKILGGKAFVYPFTTAENIPTDQEQKRQVSTYRRMRKYSMRGFQFENLPSIVSSGAFHLIEGAPTEL